MRKISERKRIVVKVGTSTLTHRTGRLNIRRVEQLVKTLADIYNAGHEVVLVSSGAIGLGMGKLGLVERPKDTPGKQACAAVGQCELMNLYGNLFSDYSITVAQMLLTRYIFMNILTASAHVMFESPEGNFLTGSRSASAVCASLETDPRANQSK